MKKLFLGIGAIAAVVTPVIAVVSCGKEVAKAGFTIDVSKQSGGITEQQDKINDQLTKLKAFAEFHANSTIVINVKVDESVVVPMDLHVGKEQLLEWNVRDYGMYILNNIGPSFAPLIHV